MHKAQFQPIIKLFKKSVLEIDSKQQYTDYYQHGGTVVCICLHTIAFRPNIMCHVR